MMLRINSSVLCDRKQLSGSCKLCLIAGNKGYDRSIPASSPETERCRFGGHGRPHASQTAALAARRCYAAAPSAAGTSSCAESPHALLLPAVNSEMGLSVQHLAQHSSLVVCSCPLTALEKGLIEIASLKHRFAQLQALGGMQEGRSTAGKQREVGLQLAVSAIL
jgi:hypothetical protein